MLRRLPAIACGLAALSLVMPEGSAIGIEAAKPPAGKPKPTVDPQSPRVRGAIDPCSRLATSKGVFGAVTVTLPKGDPLEPRVSGSPALGPHREEIERCVRDALVKVARRLDLESADPALQRWPWEFSFTMGETPTPRKAVALASGTSHVCALLEDGAVVCWGNNGTGELGVKPEDVPQATRPRKLAGLTGATALALGQEHTCALFPTGKVQCLGWRHFGEIGDGVAAGYNPTIEPHEARGLVDVEQLAAGPGTTCAVQKGGRTFCWGRWPWVNGEANRLFPDPFDNRRDAVQVAVGAFMVCVRRRDGDADCGGATRDALPDTISGPPPPVVTGKLQAVDLAAGNEFACVIRRSGEVACMGVNMYGELGLEWGKVMRRWKWAIVPGLRDNVAIAAGDHHACAVTRDGRLHCWGNGVFGQLGTPGGGDEHAHYKTVEVRGLPPVRAAALGGQSSCALTQSGEIWCWGENERGQLGDGTTTRSSIPRRVALPPASR